VERTATASVILNANDLGCLATYFDPLGALSRSPNGRAGEQITCESVSEALQRFGEAALVDGEQLQRRRALWLRRRFRGATPHMEPTLPAGGLFAWPSPRPDGAAIQVFGGRAGAREGAKIPSKFVYDPA